MRNKAICGLFVIIIWSITGVRAQYYFYNERFYDAPLTFDVGLSAGAMNCLTDLGGKMETGSRFLHDLNGNTTHACGGLFAGLEYSGLLTLRMELALGTVSAADSLLAKYVSPRNGRFLRNLSFRSPVREWSLMAGIYPMGMVPNLKLVASPYLLAGIGLFHFQPAADLRGQQISLPPLHTEGQGFPGYAERTPYRLTQWNLPLGGGFRCELGPCASIRMELVYRVLFTDYLDDVSTTYIPVTMFNSQLPPREAALAPMLADRRTLPGDPASRKTVRGNPAHNDAYFSVQLKFSMVLGRKRI